MSDSILDVTLNDLYRDSRIVNRVVEAIMLDQGVDYIAALDKLHKGTESAHANRLTTVRGALEWAHTKPEDVESVVKMLDRRDEAVTRTLDQSLSLLDQADEPDFAALLADPDPVKRQRRYDRAKTLDRSYQGPEGRKLFDQTDRLYLESGRDIVGEMEHAAGEQAAHAKAGQVKVMLDQAIEKSGSKHQKLRMLEAAIEELPDADLGAVDLRVSAETSREIREPVVMLDQLEASAGRFEAGAAPEPTVPTDGHALYELTTERMRLLDRDPGEFLKTLEEVMDGKPMPAKAPETPPGVYGPNHETHKRVRQVMTELGRRESEYVKTLEQVMRGEL